MRSVAGRIVLAVLLLSGMLAGGAWRAWAAAAPGASPQQQFRAAGESARSGDYPKSLALYQALAATGHESASLYWNWSQVASARGAQGEALWALLRARELDPSDRAVQRSLDRLREAANLDRAEIAPDPRATLARVSRRFRLDVAAVLLLLISLAVHAGIKWRGPRSRLTVMAWVSGALGLVVAFVPIVGSFARPAGVVASRGVALLDAASSTAETVGTLREGEVVPILESSGGYVRVEDSSGARGWAVASQVRALFEAPGSSGQ